MVFSISGVLGVWTAARVMGGAVRPQDKEIADLLRFIVSFGQPISANINLF